MIGDEARVAAAFADWLRSDGWTVSLEVKHVDVVAVRGEHRLYAEVKGRTSDAGLDVDTAYGQLLRRMTDSEPGDVRYAIVVPTGAVKAALRVPPHVRTALHIDVYEVDDSGTVHSG